MMEELDAAAEAARMTGSDTESVDPGDWQPTHKSEPGEPLPRPASRGSGSVAFDDDDDPDRDEDDIEDDDDGYEHEG